MNGVPRRCLNAWFVRIIRKLVMQTDRDDMARIDVGKSAYHHLSQGETQVWSGFSSAKYRDAAERAVAGSD